MSLAHLMRLKGRQALITGAAGCLGRTIAQTLAELGADLILLDRPEANFEAVQQALAPFGEMSVQIVPCDLETEANRSECVTRIHEECGRLDILVNNAAFVGTSDLTGWCVPFPEQSLSTWRRAVEVNLTAAFHLSRDLAPLLARHHCGSIINVASIYGHCGPDWGLYEGTQMGNPAAYAASKGGLLQLTRWLATTLSPDIRVNAISPGGIARGQAPAFVEKYCARTPLGRMAEEEDFVGSIAFLASDMSKYMTGENLHVDGGWSIW